jgi:DNA invertase Pin-like site-specific DNA recombinase
MNEKLKPHHLERLAVVYVRQSSPTQVRCHLESPQRQRALRQRALELGWAESQVVVLEESRAKSGGSRHGRHAYHELSELVAQRRAGIVLAVEVARWARDTAAWQLLLRDCIFEDVLLADQEHLYDPSDPHDHVMLGIQGALAQYELRLIATRTIGCWWAKAQRGEIVTPIPTGFVPAQKYLDKHPHRRVRHSLDRLFERFREVSSVLQLCRGYLERNELLPYVPHGDDPQQVQWRPASYKRLLGILKNPAYAGAYVIGRRTTVQVRDEQGETVSKRRCVPQEQWRVIEKDCFEGYLSWTQYEENMARIQKNTWPKGMSGTARRGTSLLSGLLRCARCGSALHVQYHRKHASYICRGGARQRERGPFCLSFSGRHVEPLFTEMLREAVRPAGVEAARRAAALVREQSQRDRQTLLEQWEQLQYEAERARRQYDHVEPENRLVAETLERRWNETLAAVAAQRARLDEFDRTHAPPPSDEELQSLTSLGARWEKLWEAASTDVTWQKQLVHLLVQEVMVALSEDGEEVELWIHWKGGHHTLLTAPRRARRGGGSADVLTLIRFLRAVCDDASIARTLNRHGVRQGAASWTASSVRAFRQRHGIAGFDAAEKARRGLLTGEEVGRQLEISAMSVHRLVQAGILPAEQARRGLPSIILASDVKLPEVQQAARRIRANLPRPLPADPNQRKLF